MPDRYDAFPSLKFERPESGILRLIMSAPGKLNAADAGMHRDLATVWEEIDRDADARVVIVEGEGKAFSAGGDLDLVQSMAEDFAVRIRVMKEARDLVYNVIDCSKPIVSAMRGPAAPLTAAPGSSSDRWRGNWR